MKNSLRIKRLVGMAVLTSLVVALQLISNYVTIGSISITLSLIPIAVGAILYGPVAGLFLGLVMGALVIAAPSTLASFMPYNPAATIILCLAKGGVAGLLSGFVFKGIGHFAGKTENVNAKRTIFAVAAVIATIIVPVVNTTIFLFGGAIFFQSLFGASDFTSAFVVIFGAVFGTNFVLELVVSAVMSPSVVTLVKVLTRNYNLGFTNDFSKYAYEEETAVSADTKEVLE